MSTNLTEIQELIIKRKDLHYFLEYEIKTGQFKLAKRTLKNMIIVTKRLTKLYEAKTILETEREIEKIRQNKINNGDRTGVNCDDYYLNKYSLNPNCNEVKK